MHITVPHKKRSRATHITDGGVPLVVHAFVQRAGNVVQTVVSVSNSIPHVNRNARTELSIELPHGKWVNEYNVFIPPLKTLTLTYYTGGTEQEFWAKWRGNKLPGQTERLCKPWMREGLDKIFMAHSPYQIGPYTIGWHADPGGNGPGGQGIEPHRHLWRNCGSGRGLAFRSATATANRMDVFCSTDAGDPLRIDWVRTTTEAQDEQLLADNGFDRGCEDKYGYEKPLMKYQRFDGQHWARACQDAVWLARQGHPWAIWYCGHLLNWQASVYLEESGDDKPNQGYWSLPKLLAELSGPQQQHCGRAGVHQARFAQQCAEIRELRDPALELSRLWAGLFRRSCGLMPRDKQQWGVQGLPYGIPSYKMGHPSWSGYPYRTDNWGAQTRELYLAISLFEGWGMYVHAERIRHHPAMQGHPSAKVSLDSPWQSEEGPNPFYAMLADPMNLAEFEDDSPRPPRQVLKEMAQARLNAQNGPEAGGAQPLNSCPREVLALLK